MKTFADLEIGTCVYYNDMANINHEVVVLDHKQNCCGFVVNVLVIMEDGSRYMDNIMPKTEIGERWTLSRI